MCRVDSLIQLANNVPWVTCRVDFHTQLADKANQYNSDDVKQLLQAVYDIMAPEGEDYVGKARVHPLSALRRPLP